MRVRALLAGLLLASSAMAADRPPPLPTFGEAYTPTTVDERGVWMLADEDERRLRDARDVIRDPALNDYVRQVLCRTVGADRCRAVRLYIQHIPAFNASMAPNGAMTIWTGLLLRVRTEAELGAVLGHEFGHFELRHTLSSFRNRRSGTDVMAWASVLMTNSAGFQLDTIGQIYAFDRAQEKDADLIGFRYLAASGYPATAAADVWDRAMGEADATAIGRKGRAQHKYLAGMFASHPTDLARATYLRAAATTVAAPAAPPADGYRAALAPWLPIFLADQIKLNDFGGTEYILGQLAADGWTTPLLFARGELYRERGNPRDLVSAADFYEQAIAHGDAPAEAYRGLGLARLRAGQVEPGRAALRDYLRLKPTASDAAAIAALVA